MKPVVLKPAALKAIVMKRIGLKRIGAASLILALPSLMFGQQQPPPATPEPPPPQQQIQAATAAPPEISKEDPDYGEPWGLGYWLTGGGSKLLPGAKAVLPVDQTLGMPRARPRSPEVFLSFPAGKFNHLEISYFQTDGTGTGVAAVPLGLFGQDIPQGDFLSNTYRLRNAQMAWNYLNWPAPPEDSKWRFRTLYAFDYFSDSVTIDAPFEADPNFNAAHGTKNIFTPAFGAIGEYIPSKYFHLELRTWGFGFPHRSAIGDAEANAVLRIKHVELFGGFKFFHFKTSPQNDQYFVGTVQGLSFGARWSFR